MRLFEIYDNYWDIYSEFINYNSVPEERSIRVLEKISKHNHLFKNSQIDSDEEKSNIIEEYYPKSVIRHHYNIFEIVSSSLIRLLDYKIPKELLLKYTLFPNSYSRIQIIKNSNIDDEILNILSQDEDTGVRSLAKTKLELITKSQND